LTTLGIPAIAITNNYVQGKGKGFDNRGLVFKSSFTVLWKNGSLEENVILLTPVTKLLSLVFSEACINIYMYGTASNIYLLVFSLLTYTFMFFKLHVHMLSDSFKNSCYFVIQSELKTKPIVTYLHMLSHTLNQLHELTLCFDKFLELY